MQEIQLRIQPNDDVLQLYSRACSPCRDYYVLIVSPEYVALNIWKITHRPYANPKLNRCPIEEFKYDKSFQETIKNCFTVGVYNYILDLSYSRRKLENLPVKIFMHILTFLRINDILRMMRCSKIMFERCNQNTVWRLIFVKKFARFPSKEENLLALDYTWKTIYQKRLEFVLRALKQKTDKEENEKKKKKRNSSLCVQRGRIKLSQPTN
ncbi:F-box only protein 36-like [Rhynchophorus ferrugineus]|uniref:F-box only protein 36-like n=1 Tax=Rhynchophorus ferrugineus TaxID=354439 RepID=UPI003FCD8989